MLILRLQDLEEAKNLAGKLLRLTQIGLTRPSLEKSRQLVYTTLVYQVRPYTLAAHQQSTSHPLAQANCPKPLTAVVIKRQIVHNPSELANLPCFPANCPLWRQK